jgi:hypothetical protein
MAGCDDIGLVGEAINGTGGARGGCAGAALQYEHPDGSGTPWHLWHCCDRGGLPNCPHWLQPSASGLPLQALH